MQHHKLCIIWSSYELIWHFIQNKPFLENYLNDYKKSYFIK
jgi:hypothetical protein